MSIIRTEIEEAIIKSKVKAREISVQKAAWIYDSIAAKYTNVTGDYVWLWENFRDEYSVNDTEAWSWISYYVKNQPCYFIVNHCGEKTAYYFECGNSMIDMYNETGQLIEFYVTDEEFSYLLCYNHHDYLIACGEAKKWLIDFYADYK